MIDRLHCIVLSGSIFLQQLNQVVIWDKIIRRGENAMLDYRSINTKYYFWDYGNGLK